MSFDFMLDETGDIKFDYDSVDFTPVTKIEDSFKQRLQIRLRTNRGEWGFNTTDGLPYTSEIIGQKFNKNTLSAIVYSEAIREVGVNNIFDFSIAKEADSRDLNIEFRTSTDVGELYIPIKPHLVSDDNEYPDTQDFDVTLTCGVNTLIPYINNLYYLLNFQLPEGGVYTWYDTTGLLSAGLGGDEEVMELASRLHTLLYEEIPIGGTIPWDYNLD